MVKPKCSENIKKTSRFRTTYIQTTQVLDQNNIQQNEMAGMKQNLGSAAVIYSPFQK